MSSGGYQISKQVRRDMSEIKNDILEIKRLIENGTRGKAKESINHVLKIVNEYVEVEK